MNPTTRRFSRSLAEAFPRDYACAIERPAPRMRFWPYAVAALVAVAALAVKFTVGA